MPLSGRQRQKRTPNFTDARDAKAGRVVITRWLCARRDSKIFTLQSSIWNVFGRGRVMFYDMMISSIPAQEHIRKHRKKRKWNHNVYNFYTILIISNTSVTILKNLHFTILINPRFMLLRVSESWILEFQSFFHRYLNICFW